MSLYQLELYRHLLLAPFLQRARGLVVLIRLQLQDLGHVRHQVGQLAVELDLLLPTPHLTLNHLPTDNGRDASMQHSQMFICDLMDWGACGLREELYADLEIHQQLLICKTKSCSSREPRHAGPCFQARVPHNRGSLLQDSQMGILTLCYGQVGTSEYDGCKLKTLVVTLAAASSAQFEGFCMESLPTLQPMASLLSFVFSSMVLISCVRRCCSPLRTKTVSKSSVLWQQSQMERADGKACPSPLL